jgi:hypothetical protein
MKIAHDPPKHALGLDPGCERFGDKIMRHNGAAESLIRPRLDAFAQ